MPLPHLHEWRALFALRAEKMEESKGGRKVRPTRLSSLRGLSPEEQTRRVEEVMGPNARTRR